MKIVTAIYDNVAESLVGQVLMLHAHEAAAIRMFRDILSNKDSDIGRHPHDYDLFQLGIIHDEAGRNMIDSDFRVIITGQQLHDATTNTLEAQ